MYRGGISSVRRKDIPSTVEGIQYIGGTVALLWRGIIYNVEGYHTVLWRDIFSTTEDILLY